ncbi:MAG: leucine-rich repeat protein [Bacteroidaceae bacterium]|nr:leucine-rich repeat protein [Bacteroidaceae bacterium]
MRKKLLSICLLLLIAISAGAQTEFTVDNFKYTVTDDVNHYVSIAKADEATFTSPLVIPSSVTYEAVNYAVTAVGDGGFNGTGITSVTIPASVLNIGNAAFQACGSLASITIEDSETPLTMPGTWYERPFWSPATTIYIGRDLTLTGGENNPLTYDAISVEFGPKVTTINPALFYGNSHLASITIRSGVTTISESAFYSCGQDEGVTETVVSMGSNVTSIGANAFRDCPKLKSLTLPSKLTTIGNNAFNGSGLTSVTIPASVMNIGDYAFQNCGSMTSITIEDSETPLTMPGTWYERPLANAATTIYIGRNLTLTGDDDYQLLDYATSVEFGPQVTTINPRLFYSNTKLESITIGSGVTTIGESAFYMCGTYWDEETNQGVDELVVTMGSNVTSIGTNAFLECTHLKAIALPSTLTTIGNGAFSNSGLTSISIPASVMTIGDAAFGGCNSMTSITIEDSETPLTMTGSWYERPFWNSATSIYLGRNVTLTEEVNPIFVSATSVEFGSKVTEISAPISGVLTSVKVPWLTPITIAADLFNETELENATLWVPGGTMDAYEDATGWQAFTNKEFASYVVSVQTIGHGTLAVADIEAGMGETETTLIDRETDVVFTVTPATGYELTTFTVNDVAATPTEGSYTVEDLSADQTVVAGFTPITYTLTYTMNGGTATPANPATYTIETTTFTLTNPTRTGYDFAGWKLNGEGDALMTVTITKGSTGDLKYTATWTPIIYNIALTLNGGTADNPATYTIESAAITLNNPTREGYTFAGWKLNGEGVALMSVTIVAGSTGNKAYTATWTPVSYTISYDLAGGSVASANPTSYNIESEDITLNNPTKDHYNFAGWTGTGLDAATESVTITTGSTGNRSYTATWTEKTYMVTITGGGVTADNDNPQYGDDVVLTIMDDPDAMLTSLTVNGTEVKESIVDNQYTIENVSGNVSVVATWSSTKEFITLAHAQATFSCDRDLDFSEVSGLKAYIASGFNRSTGTVLLTRVESVPARTGLLLVGTEGATYKVPYAESTSFFVNLLQPVLDAQVVPATVSTYTNFLYGEKEGVQGFYMSSGEGTVSAKKAYLQLPTAALGGGSSVRVAILFDDADEDEETAIKDMQMANGDEAVYNLNGLRVANKRDMNRLPKGIYIIGGRKVTLK